jgi:RNA polymerase sigma-70 factor (ECF subfamily)
MSDSITAGLAVVEALSESGDLDGYYLLPATRADLLRRAGRLTEAATSYEEALNLAPSDSERRYLKARLHSL